MRQRRTPAGKRALTNKLDEVESEERVGLDSILLNPFTPLPSKLQGGVIAFGNFDGVHRGHCRLLAKLRERARHAGGPAIAISFDPHPLALLRPEAVPAPLVSSARKHEILLASGADGVAILQTSPAFLQLTADQFFDEIVRGRFNAKGMVEGRNFCYGRDRGGSVATLASQCERSGMSLDIVDIITGAGAEEVSSTRIRRELTSGAFALGVELLGRPHRVTGRVVHGDKRGATLGFPTANLEEIQVLLPKEGVYAGQTRVEGKTYSVAVNIGANPTFGVNQRKVEVHLLDFAGDLYGQWLDVDLVEWLRDVRNFASLEELKGQLKVDVENASAAARRYRFPFGTNLGQTIMEWLRGELESSLANVGGKLTGCELTDDGTLTVTISLVQPLPPPFTDELGLRLDSRLARVFSEVKSLRWRTRDC